MAFDKAYLTRVGGNATQQVWTYRSADAAATIKASDYFLDMIDDFIVSDIILVSAVYGGTAVIQVLQVTNVTTTVDTDDNITQT
jgi:hypothetical protein